MITKRNVDKRRRECQRKCDGFYRKKGDGYPVNSFPYTKLSYSSG
jgi:hypothetical protein